MTTAKRITVLALAAAAATSAALLAPRGSAAAEPPPAAPPPPGVRTIVLPDVPVDLPPGPGRGTVMSTCVICHTTRYLTGQPPLTRAKWTEEVDKMRKAFGAPVTDEQVPPIVEYLAAIRGAPEPPSTQPATKP